MALFAREATHDDFPAMLRLAYGPSATNPRLTQEIRREWDWLWATGRFLAVAVCDTVSSSVVGLMGGLHLTEAMFQSLRVDPAPYVNRRLGREPQPGDRPLPPASGLIDRSATLYIAYFAWQSEFRDDDLTVLRGYVANAFLDLHGGFAIRRVCLEACGREYMELAVKQGVAVINDHARWVEENAVTERDHPYFLAIEREAALATENHWYSRLFRFQPAVLGFSAGQREMLRLARRGLTDVQLAEALSLSHAAIKKRWEGVYSRFHDRSPGILPLGDGGKRGGEKRRLALLHLQDRLEELRP